MSLDLEKLADEVTTAFLDENGFRWEGENGGAGSAVLEVLLGAAILSALQRVYAEARAERDMEWWEAVILVDNVAPTPEGGKHWQAILGQHIEEETRKETMEKACAAVCPACRGVWKRLFNQAATFPAVVGRWWHEKLDSDDPIDSGTDCQADSIRRAFESRPASLEPPSTP